MAKLRADVRYYMLDVVCVGYAALGGFREYPHTINPSWESLGIGRKLLGRSGCGDWWGIGAWRDKASHAQIPMCAIHCLRVLGWRSCQQSSL